MKIRSSKLCIRKIYSLVDMQLDKSIINKMSLKERYSMIIQVLYFVYLMDKSDYVHGDLHLGNIGIININKNKNLNIFNHQIPTFGRQYQAIDYGSLLNKNTASTTKTFQILHHTEKKHYDDSKFNDRNIIINTMIDKTKFKKFIRDNKIKCDENINDIILAQPETKLLYNIINDNKLLFKLYQILFCKKFQKIYMGKKFKYELPFNYLIPIEDIIFFYMNFNDLKTCILYFIQKLN
jgi:hypothetical protein